MKTTSKKRSVEDSPAELNENRMPKLLAMFLWYRLFSVLSHILMI